MEDRESVTITDTPSSWGDESCSFCGKEPVVVIVGAANCYYCGNSVPLCREHLEILKGELDADKEV